MKYPSKYHVTSATGKRNVFDLSQNLVTTNDFGIIKPIYMRMMVPGDKFDIDVSSFTRLMPMPCPTYGKIDVVNRAFFVPMRTIFRHWNDFLSNNFVTFSGTTQSVSTVFFTYAQFFVRLFINGQNGYMETTTAGNGQEVIFYDSDDMPKYEYYKFTPKGRRVFDMLNSIGLRFPWAYGVTSNPDFSQRILNQKINIMPLIALSKFYLDWIVPSRFVSEYDDVRRFFEREPTTANLFCQVSDIKKLIYPLYSFLGDDYFTSAFINPFGYETTVANSTTLPNPGNAPSDDALLSTVSVNRNSDIDSTLSRSGAMAYTGGDEDPTYINYFTMQSLGALQHMVNSGKLAGTKVQDYMKVTYGIDIDPKILNLSTYLGSHRSTIQIGDVMSQAGTSENALGEYAGKGIGGSSNEHFSYETKEHGFIFVTSEILITPSYVDGLAHEFQMLDRLSMFAVPELDNLGVEAIPLADINNSLQNMRWASIAVDEAPYPDAVFGFTPRFSKFKVGFDRLSGDFRCAQLNENLKSWYLKRHFELENGNQWQTINSKFVQGDTDQFANNYDYIFNVANNDSDHFYQIFRIDVKAVRPMQLISQALEVDHEPKMGKDVKVSINDSVE